MSKQDYYELLGVSKTATSEEIKRAFRNKAKECHPDHHPGDKEAEKKFKELGEAYEVLKDEQKRAAYDRFGPDAFAGGMGGGAGGFGGFGGFNFTDSGFEDIFEQMFSGFAGGTRQRGKKNLRGEDVRKDLTITLEEAYAGIKKPVAVDTYVKCDDCGGKGGKSIQTCPHCGGRGRIRQRQGFFMMESDCAGCQGTGQIVKDPCEKCKGTGRVRKKRTLEVDIPRGVDSGIRMRLAGEGNAGLRGGERGDLYVFLTVREHDVFKRNGDDLYLEMPISFTQAALGASVDIPTIDGIGEKYEIKAGMQTGTQIRFKGKGMPLLRAGTFGDLYVTFKVTTPKNLTAKEKELLKEFAALRGDEVAECTDFLCKIKRFLSGE